MLKQKEHYMFPLVAQDMTFGWERVITILVSTVGQRWSNRMHNILLGNNNKTKMGESNNNSPIFHINSYWKDFFLMP